MEGQISSNATEFEVTLTDDAEVKSAKAVKVIYEPNETEAKYRSMFANMLDGFAFCKMVFNENGKPVDFVYLEVNDAFERLTGLKKEVILGKRITEAIPGAEAANPELFEIYGKVAQTGKEEKFEIFFQPLNKWFSISAYCPQKDYFATIFEDITEYKKTLEKLSFQAQVLDSAGQAIIVADEQQIINYWNNGAQKLFGWSAAEATGRIIEQVLFKDFSAYEVIDVSRRLMAGESWSRETEVKCRNGSIVPVIINRSPIFNQEGLFVGPINVITDISDQKWMENELIAYANAFVANSQKIESLNEKLRVVGGLTRHDVRNKLSAINGHLYLLKKRIGDNQAAMDQVTEMENISKQILEILEFERVYEQVGSEGLTYVEVCRFFQEACELVADFKGIKPECYCEGLTILADSLLRQLLYNFMDNTLKYGEKTSEIKLSYREEMNQLLLIYEDNGVGVTEETRKHLFEKGFGKGTGFGLYMIKRIVNGYGWKIEENGKPLQGIRFTITIPADKYQLQIKPT